MPCSPAIDPPSATTSSIRSSPAARRGEHSAPRSLGRPARWRGCSRLRRDPMRMSAGPARRRSPRTGRVPARAARREHDVLGDLRPEDAADDAVDAVPPPPQLGRVRTSCASIASSPTAAISSPRCALRLLATAVDLHDQREAGLRRHLAGERRPGHLHVAPSRKSSTDGPHARGHDRRDRLAARPARGQEQDRARSAQLGRGQQPQRTSVMTPSVPSEPTSSSSGHSRRRPCRPIRRHARARRARAPPPGPTTQRPVTPCLTACGPPALVATFPPICDCSAAPGSGANISPFSRASR